MNFKVQRKSCFKFSNCMFVKSPRPQTKFSLHLSAKLWSACRRQPFSCFSFVFILNQIFFVFVTFEETAPPPAFSRCTKIGSSPQSSMITTSVLICANVCYFTLSHFTASRACVPSIWHQHHSTRLTHCPHTAPSLIGRLLLTSRFEQ